MRDNDDDDDDDDDVNKQYQEREKEKEQMRTFVKPAPYLAPLGDQGIRHTQWGRGDEIDT